MARRSGRGLRDIDIEDLLGDSDIGDFIDSDDDSGDPEYNPTRETRSVSDSDSSESDGETINSTEQRESNHERAEEEVAARRARGRSRGGSRARSRGGSRGRSCGRGRSVASVPSSSGSTQNAWSEQQYLPKTLNILEPSYVPNDTEGFSKVDYFKQYFDEELYTICVEKTNQTSVQLTGQSLNLSVPELKMYFALNMVMASINYPVLRMYWTGRWRIPIVADNMSRNRYQQLRNSLKLVFENDVSTETKSKDKLYKMRLLIDRMQRGCRLQDKSQSISIDEMIIPFTGSCSVKQYCPGKPNPTGLKAFVLANPDGVVCDFHVYQGKTTYPEHESSNRGLAENAVLTLADQLVPGHVIYCDRYFTSQKLCDQLKLRGIGCTGTLQKNRIPPGCKPKDDKTLKSEGRGSSHVLVREDGELAFTKWFDNKPVLFLSSVEANDNSDHCQRWCKKTKRYLSVARPQVVREYNRNMGGVDLADRLLAVCPNRYKTNKWTQRFICHMLDLAVSNSWLQYKKDEKRKQTPAKKILMLREFKLQLGEDLIDEVSVKPNPMDQESDVETDQQEPAPSRKRGRPSVCLPSKTRRVTEAKHMPNLDEKQSRCRVCHYNKTHFRCTTCNVFLCLTKVRNCYADFHAKENEV